RAVRAGLGGGLLDQLPDRARASLLGGAAQSLRLRGVVLPERLGAPEQLLHRLAGLGGQLGLLLGEGPQRRAVGGRERRVVPPGGALPDLARAPLALGELLADPRHRPPREERVLAAVEHRQRLADPVAGRPLLARGTLR